MVFSAWVVAAARQCADMEAQVAGLSPFAVAWGVWCRRHSSLASSERSRDEHGIRTVCRHACYSERSGSDPGVVFALRARQVGRSDLIYEPEVNISGSSTGIAVSVGLPMLLFLLDLSGCGRSSERRQGRTGARSIALAIQRAATLCQLGGTAISERSRNRKAS